VKAMLRFAAAKDYEFGILRSVEAVNEQQKLRLLVKMQRHFGSIKGKRIAVWGLSFKPRTDDMREAPSVPLINGILAAGAAVHAYDPEAMKVARGIFGAKIQYADKSYDALAGADGRGRAGYGPAHRDAAAFRREGGHALCRAAVGRRFRQRPGRLLRQQRRRDLVGAGRDGGGGRAALHLLVNGGRVRRSDRDADYGRPSEDADQRVRRDEVGDRAGAAAFRPRVRAAMDRAAVLQRRGSGP